MNTYTEQQIENAIDIMETVWGDKPDYQALSESAKDLLAHAILRANDLVKLKQ